MFQQGHQPPETIAHTEMANAEDAPLVEIARQALQQSQALRYDVICIDAESLLPPVGMMAIDALEPCSNVRRMASTSLDDLSAQARCNMEAMICTSGPHGARSVQLIDTRGQIIYLPDGERFWQMDELAITDYLRAL